MTTLNEHIAMKYYYNSWCNTGMKNQPTWMYKTSNKDGKLGDAIGDIVLVSYESKSCYVLYREEGVISSFPLNKVLDCKNLDMQEDWDLDGVIHTLAMEWESLERLGYCILYDQDAANRFKALGYECYEFYDHEDMCDAYLIHKEGFDVDALFYSWL